VTERGDLRQAAARVLDRDEVEGVLSGTFYTAAPHLAAPISETVPKQEGKPQHYKVICISMYTDDLKRLDQMVENLKARGLTKANRSALIRYALAEVDLDRVPRGL
jgi:poly-gamma-glutamate capsule biosynthesis protein CapA/YwtB (metallophosphatase superfamily)